MIRCSNTREKRGRDDDEMYNMLDAVNVVSYKIQSEGERARVDPDCKYLEM